MNTQSNNHNQTEIGAVNTISAQAKYQADPLAVYRLLCGKQAHKLLLESAEIDKKHQLKSLLLTDAALKIVCFGNQVSFIALTENGKAAVKYAEQQLKNLAALTFAENTLVATFPEVAQELDEKSRLTATNAFQALRLFKQLNNNDQHPFAVFLAGAFAFDMMAMAEKLPEVADGENTCPDFIYYLAETMVVIDHETATTEVLGNVFTSEHQASDYQHIQTRISEISSQLAQNITFPAFTEDNSIETPQAVADISDDKFCAHVNQLKEHICAGDIFQVVPSRTFSIACKDTFNAYQALKKSNPSPYMFYIQDSDFCMFGASPESAIKYQQHNRQVEIYPIAGTRPRGFKADGSFSVDLDSRIELDLRQDKKELAEHIMLVDLARNDVARVSQPGTRHVADLLKVDRYSHVMHLVSRVVGTLANDLDALHAYQACMNMGTLSGAPKVRATELIRLVEGKRRGSYGGAVGYLTGDGDMDTCIVIRSAFVKDNVAQIQAGAGVVYDSDPQSEANETRQKAQAVINAIQIAAKFTQSSSQTSANTEEQANA